MKDFLLDFGKEGRPMVSRPSITCFLLPIFLGLSACSEQEVPLKRTSGIEERMKADTDLMRDISRAGTELERRLNEVVRAQDGVVIARDPIIGEYFLRVLSPNSPWVLTCGAGGISIVFGASVTGHEGSTSNDVEINLAYNNVDEKDCAVLGVRLGKRLNAIF
jgi:hypothetical protein